MLLDRSLITRTSIQDVGRLLQFSEAENWDGFRQYSNTCDPVSLVFLDNINAVWSKSSKIQLPKYEDITVVHNSLLHRWIVLDAVESAASISQGTHRKAAIDAVRAWIVHPSKQNRDSVVSAYDGLIYATDSRSIATCRIAYIAWTNNAIPEAAANAAWSSTWAATWTLGISAETVIAAVAAVKLRIQVLAAIQDYLPEPP